MPKTKWWLAAWIVLAAATAVPAGLAAYERLERISWEAREKFIVQHQLWEQDRNYFGSPKTWTRVASRVLTDRQLMRRVRAKYGDAAMQVELEYRRDLTIAQAEAAVTALLIWAAPLAGLLAAGYAVHRLRRRAPPPPPPRPRHASYDDPRYRS